MAVIGSAIRWTLMSSGLVFLFLLAALGTNVWRLRSDGRLLLRHTCQQLQIPADTERRDDRDNAERPLG